MSEHKYHVGQAVEFFPERGVEHTAKGRFKIVRLLLDERNAPRYRIKHEVDGHDEINLSHSRKKRWNALLSFTLPLCARARRIRLYQARRTALDHRSSRVI